MPDLTPAAADVLDPGHSYQDVLQAVAAGEAAPPEFWGEPSALIPLTDGSLSLGRRAPADVVLSHPSVSGRHAALERGPAGWVVRDLRSRTGTFVNGKAVLRAQVRPGDQLQLGPYLFKLQGNALVWLRQPAVVTLAALNIRQTAGTVPLLDDVSLVLPPGAFVGLLGPSGAGKTTLLTALSGVRPAAGGQVLLNGESLYEQYDRWRRLIGYVPQDEIVHPELTCRQTFCYAARLRLPADVPAEELATAVDEALETLDLMDRANVPVGRLSGGQRKRVSVGVELLARPRLLFLDEPTSGLDPGTEARLMRLFRDLAREGRTVICTTHSMATVDLFDAVAILAEGGRLAYFGPPAGALEHFGADRLADVYDRLPEQSPEAWQARFREAPLGQALHRQAAEERRPRPFHRQRRPESGARLSGPAQWGLLTRRFARTLVADPRAPALALAQPLLIGGLVAAVFRDLRSVYFLLVVSALWFGCSLAAQQIVKERAVYCRERMAGLDLRAYLLSKFIPLAAMSALQAALMLTLVWVFKGTAGVQWMQLVGLTLAGWNGAALGLLISALATNADRATAVVPLTMLPQIILGGVLIALPDMNAPTRAAAELSAARWANGAMEAAAFHGRVVDHTLLRDPADFWPLWNLYPAYNLREEEERYRFVGEKENERLGLGGAFVLDAAALAGLILVQLLALAVVLKSQDAL